MRSKNKTRIFSNIFIMMFLITFSFCTSPVESEISSSSVVDIEKTLESMEIEDLSQNEIDGLIFMREEEKLARDVYLTLYETWGQRVFSNIAQSEQKHTDAIKLLLERYDLSDPVTSDEIGVFINAELQKLYNDLVERGNQSLLEALYVGAAIEEIDILDLEDQINLVVDNEDIIFVYSNLLNGSKNHLRAFVRNISSQGEEYEPQHLDTVTYEAIIQDENMQKGKGKRYGKGRSSKP